MTSANSVRPWPRWRRPRPRRKQSMQAHGWFTVMSELHGAIEPAVRLCAVMVKLPFGAPVGADDGTGEVVGRPVDRRRLRC